MDLSWCVLYENFEAENNVDGGVFVARRKRKKAGSNHPLPLSVLDAFVLRSFHVHALR